jgi:hypothetical protein
LAFDLPEFGCPSARRKSVGEVGNRGRGNYLERDTDESLAG